MSWVLTDAQRHTLAAVFVETFRPLLAARNEPVAPVVHYAYTDRPSESEWCECCGVNVECEGMGVSPSYDDLVFGVRALAAYVASDKGLSEATRPLYFTFGTDLEFLDIRALGPDTLLFCLRQRVE